uniref:Retrotrans_gag domain-containing protein n=1 Tax=Glossina austeni TaxID=7395 RepID=A0A1A9V0Z5_GLOAU
MPVHPEVANDETYQQFEGKVNVLEEKVGNTIGQLDARLNAQEKDGDAGKNEIKALKKELAKLQTNDVTTSSIKVKTPLCAGATNFNAFKLQFGVVATKNIWDDDDKAVVLITSLRGAAAEIIQMIPEGKRTEFAAIMDALERKYGSKHVKELTHLESSSCCQKLNERIQDYATEIERLANLAYIGVPDDVLERLKIDAFVKGLRDAELKKAAWTSAKTTFTETLGFALTQEAASVLSISRMWFARCFDKSCAKISECRLAKHASVMPAKNLVVLHGNADQSTKEYIPHHLHGILVKVSAKYPTNRRQTKKNQHSGATADYEISKAEVLQVVVQPQQKIPANSEAIVWATATQEKRLSTIWVVEPSKEYTKDNIIIGKAVVSQVNNLIPVRVLNPTSDPTKFQKGDIIAQCQKAENVVNHQVEILKTCSKISPETEIFIQKWTSNLDEQQKRYSKKLLLENWSISAGVASSGGRTDVANHLQLGMPMQWKKENLRRRLWEQLEKERENLSVFEFYGDSYEVSPTCSIVDEQDACTTDWRRGALTYVEAIVRRRQQSYATIQEVAEQEQREQKDDSLGGTQNIATAGKK